MKHRHLNHEGFSSAAIDDIISRGSMLDWYPLIKEIKKDPNGIVAKRTLNVCEHNPVYGSSKYFEGLVIRERENLSTPKKVSGMSM